MLKIARPCWILCTPRSGSTYLSGILNQTNLFQPPFSEYLGWKKKAFIHPRDLQSPPTFCKVLHVHLNRIFQSPNLLEDIPCDHPLQFMKPQKNYRLFIEKQMPNIRFILLTRKDTIAQAVSYCVTAEVSKVQGKSFFQITSPRQQTEFKETLVSISDETLFKYYLACRNYDTIWDDFLEDSDFFDLKYEDISDATISELLKYSGHHPRKVHCDISASLPAVSSRKDVDEMRERLRLIVYKHFPNYPS